MLYLLSVACIGCTYIFFIVIVVYVNRVAVWVAQGTINILVNLKFVPANAFASFVLGIKDIIVNEEEETVTYEINTISDVEMELGDIFGQDSQLIFLDTDLDFDLDILVAENHADNNVAFYLRLNESND